jgi:hypothetical protein
MVTIGYSVRTGCNKWGAGRELLYARDDFIARETTAQVGTYRDHCGSRTGRPSSSRAVNGSSLEISRDRQLAGWLLWRRMLRILCTSSATTVQEGSKGTHSGPAPKDGISVT